MNPVIVYLRVMQFAMIVSVILFYFVSGTVRNQAHSSTASFQWYIVICAAVSALAGFIVQRLLMRARTQALPATQDQSQLRRWNVGHILRFATAESVALFGFVLRETGSSPAVFNSLFGGGLLLLLLWQPGAIPTQTNTSSSIA